MLNDAPQSADFAAGQSYDTPWTKLRWRIACRLLWWGLRMAPDGGAACALEDMLNDWAVRCRKAWAERYPQEPANAE